MALSLIPILLLAKLLIPRYDVSTVHFSVGVDLSVTKLATRSQPPGMNNTYIDPLQCLGRERLQKASVYLPPSVVMSQKTLKEFSFFSGSIQYSPSSKESLDLRMCLQESPGDEELDPIFSKDHNK